MSIFTRASALALAAMATFVTPVRASMLNVVFYSGVTVLDPSITQAYNTRNFGYLVYGTLFAMDSKGQVQTQMVDRHSVSADHMHYSFTLCPGLRFHDGSPVAAADCVASLKRWGQRTAWASG